MPWRVVALSESYVLRAGLVVLAGTPPLEVSAEVADPSRLRSAVQATRAQIVLAAPVAGGLESTCAALLELQPICGALVLLPISGYRIQASTLNRRFGCSCLPLDASLRALHAELRMLLRPEVRSAPALVVEGRCGGPGGMLTSREHDVLRELANGSSNKTIAGRMVLSNDTIKSHLRSIYRKLGVESRGQAISLYVGDIGPVPLVAANPQLQALSA